MKVLVPLAEDFEEIEALTIVDVLRRAGIQVTTVHLGNNPVRGSHDIYVTADKGIDEVNAHDFSAMVLPGGMPGSTNLKNSTMVYESLMTIGKNDGIIGALCAASFVLGHHGFLSGKKATCYPGFEDRLTGAEHVPDPVVVDGKIVTGKGPGCALPFSLKLVELMINKETADTLKEKMMVYWM